VCATGEAGDISYRTDEMKIRFPYQAGQQIDPASLKLLKLAADRSIAEERSRREASKRMLQELESVPQIFVAV
jgi:hypothetical protein